MLSQSPYRVETENKRDRMVVHQTDKDVTISHLYEKGYYIGEVWRYSDGRQNIIRVNPHQEPNRQLRFATCRYQAADGTLLSASEGAVQAIPRNKPDAIGSIVDGQFIYNGTTETYHPQTGQVSTRQFYKHNRLVSTAIPHIAHQMETVKFHALNRHVTEERIIGFDAHVHALRLDGIAQTKTDHALSRIQRLDRFKAYVGDMAKPTRLGRFALQALDTITPYHWTERDRKTVADHQIKAVKQSVGYREPVM